MKQQKSFLAIIALFVIAFCAAQTMAQFGDLLKGAKDKVKQEANKVKEEIKQTVTGTGTPKTQPTPPQQTQASRIAENEILFSNYQSGSSDYGYTTKTSFGCADAIFAKAQFVNPVDVTNGFIVMMDVDGETVYEEQLQAAEEWNWQTVPLEIVPSDDAEIRFPATTLSMAETLLKKLSPGIHKVELGVAINEETIAVGEFNFDNRGGKCANQFARVRRTVQNPTAKKVPEKRVEQPQQPAQQQVRVREEQVEFTNPCSDVRFFYIEYPNGYTTSVIVDKLARIETYPVGSKIRHTNSYTGPLAAVVPQDDMRSSHSRLSIAARCN